MCIQDNAATNSWEKIAYPNDKEVPDLVKNLSLFLHPEELLRTNHLNLYAWVQADLFHFYWLNTIC